MPWSAVEATGAAGSRRRQEFVFAWLVKYWATVKLSAFMLKEGL
jgi:hypothetical protein